MKPIAIKGTSIDEMRTSIKAKADAYAKLSPEEREAQDKATAEILKQLGPDGPTVIMVRK